MSINVEKDLRNIKTQRALDTSMLTLLGRQKFSKITVMDICKEASISRATFYAHHLDKYDFLKYWLLLFIPENIKSDDSYENIENIVNEFIHKNKTIIKNIICDASNETLDILFDVVLYILKLDITKNSKMHPKYAVLSNMIAGGLVHYFLWLVKNNFPPTINPMNIDLFCVIENFKKIMS